MSGSMQDPSAEFILRLRRLTYFSADIRLHRVTYKFG